VPSPRGEPRARRVLELRRQQHPAMLWVTSGPRLRVESDRPDWSRRNRQHWRRGRVLAWTLQQMVNPPFVPPEGIETIAVLPFENANRDPDAEYLSDGITEDLINRLAQLGGLRVLARSTVFRYKPRSTDPQQIGRDLKTRTVLTGRVFHRGDTIVIGAELVDVANGWQLWASAIRGISPTFSTSRKRSRG